jgi:hypothetical protein
MEIQASGTLPSSADAYVADLDAGQQPENDDPSILEAAELVAMG